MVIGVGDIPCAAALDLFDFPNVSLDVGIPCNRGVFSYRPDVGFVRGFLNLEAAMTEVTLEKHTGRVEFLASNVNVCVEAQLLVNVKTQVFG